MTKRKRFYYVEPVGTFSNQIIAEAIEAKGLAYEMSLLTDTKGLKRKVWQITFDFIKVLAKTKGDIKDFKFNLFTRLSENEKLSPYSPAISTGLKNLKNDSKVKDAQKKLAILRGQQLKKIFQ